jgi:hypothetical protein
MSRQLPSKPSLRYLQQEAKDIKKAHAAGQVSCCKTLRHLGRFKERSDSEILGAKLKLTDAQFALAMEYGFKSWMELRKHILFDAIKAGKMSELKEWVSSGSIIDVCDRRRESS